MNDKTLIAFNTGILYVKLIITTILSLFATRILLDALGEIDFGVSALVSSIIAMLSFLSASLTVSTQRYMSYHLGKNDISIQKTVFTTSFFLHLFIGLIIGGVLIAMTPIIFSSVINIPEYRIEAARFIYYCTIGSTLLVIITIPYDAVLNAHENMLTVAIVNIIEASIRLCGICLLLYVKFDKLYIYGIILLIVQIVSSLIKIIYCYLKYSETLLKKEYVDKTMIRNLFSFSMWNSIGAIAVVGRLQGMAVIINIFAGVIANTAYGIANQVSGLLNTVSSYLQKAMNPQIMKQEGAGCHETMTLMALNQCKYSFILLISMGLPIIFVMHPLLSMWLGKFPPEAIIFCRLMVIIALIKQLGTGLQVAIQAVGNIKAYQLTVSLIIISSIGLAYFLLYLKYPVYYALISVLVVEFLLLFIRPWYAYKYADVSPKHYIYRVILPVLGLSLFSISLLYIAYWLLNPDSIIRAIIFLIIGFTLTIISYIPFMTKSEKNFVLAIFKSFLKEIQ